jgi:HEPN domain-containing protein
MATPETWLRQAEADLEAARSSLAAGHVEWACYQSQQAGEKALKALVYRHGMTTVRTHSLRRLVEDAVKTVPSIAGVMEDAKFLEGFFISTRYPNGLDDEVAPADFFDRKDAEKCLSSATSILFAVRKSWPA